eukprot:g10971.t2
MELGGYDAVSSSTSDVSGSVSWVYDVGSFVLFLAVIYLMCHTADNYFSPVLAVMCDLLDMPPEVAGVTFLAFGNGAPDVFSAFVALTSNTDREEGLLVGIGSLLGSTITTVTLIIGSVVFLKPTEVPRVPFTRDLVFLVLALLLVLISTSAGKVSIWLASLYLALYGVYVTFVFRGPKGGNGSKGDSLSTGSSQDGLEVGELGSGVEDHAVDARWIPHQGNGGTSGLEHGKLDGSGKLDGDQGPCSLNSAADSSQTAAARAGAAAAAGRAAGARDEFSARGHSVRHDYFGGDGGDEEKRSLLGSSGDGGGGGEGGWGEEGGADGNVFSMVPGSTVSMFLEEDDSAASWLAQRRWGKAGGTSGWGRKPSEYGASADMSEPLLQGGSRGPPASLARAEGRSLAGSSGVGRRFEHAWTTIQWRQWRLRRRVRRGIGSIDIVHLPWYRRVFWALERPFILLRNATIPPVEADSWSQTQAAVSTALAPALIVWAFGLWSTSFVGPLTCGWMALVGGLPAGAAVWLTTHKRRMPEDRWYRLALALVSFLSCVAWIYYFADLAVALIDEIGTATGIPGSVLGLTLLAWGNSAGDLVTNLAVAKAGFPGMAIAGSYGGPLFNVLLGIGLPMFYSCARFYPTAAVFELDDSTVFTACMVILVLVGTLPAVTLSGFRFPEKAPLALLGAYAVYMVGAAYYTLTFSGS